jgi:hypothetical protein
MVDSGHPGEPLIDKAAESTALAVPQPERPHPPAQLPAHAVASTAHVTSGNVLWTLAHNGSTAQARRWIVANGYEFDLRIWSGVRVEGQEDLSWSQLFATEEALAETAVAKKQQLEASGWLEVLDAFSE